MRNSFLTKTVDIHLTIHVHVYVFAGSYLVTPCNKRLYHLECILTYIHIVSRYR